MLMTIVTTIAPILIGKLADAFAAYEKKEITLAELNAKVQEALISAFAEVQKSQSVALAQTFASFMDGAKNSKLMRIVWAIVVLSQVCVLVFQQVGVPAVVYFGGGAWPSAGATIDWAYLLIVGLCGLGPVVLNRGPGKVDMTDLKNKIAK